MNYQPLLESWRNNLRIALDALGVDEESVMITDGPQCPAYAGQVFVGLYAEDLSPTDESGGLLLAQEYGCTAALTYRTNFIPHDRRGDSLYTDLSDSRIISMEEVVRRIIQTTHATLKIIVDANLKSEVPYINPLYLGRSIGKPVSVGPEHFQVLGDDDDQNSDYEGLLLELYFKGAKQFWSPVTFLPLPL